MNINYEFACQDDCLDRLIPSDLRQLVNERDQAYRNIEVLKAERDALAAQVEALRDALDKIANWNECTLEFRVNYGSNGERDFYRNVAKQALTATPQQHLAELRAEAIEHAAAYLSESIPDKSHESVIFKDRYVYISTRYLREYADSIRQGGAE